MPESNQTLGELELSALHEMANIGLGHAMTALASLTNVPFNMSVPSVDSVPVQTLSDIVGGPEALCVATYMPFEGDAEGYTAFVFPWASAQNLWRMILGSAPDSPDSVDEIQSSAMIEVGNILNSSFLNALSDTVDMRFHATPPMVGIEMTASLVTSLLAEAEMTESYALTIETAIFSDQDNSKTKGFFLCIPTFASLRQIFAKLGIAEAA